ncbi:MAG: DUF4355 domain-containing protein [Ruthenibacterium sp.]
MATFIPITTQEQLDAYLQKYADYDDLKSKAATYEKQIGTLQKAIEDSTKKQAESDKTLTELQAQRKQAETAALQMRIAHESGIPYELAARLSGETEDDLRKDAQTFSKFVGKTQTPPLQSSEPKSTDKKAAAFRALTEQLTNKGE